MEGTHMNTALDYLLNDIKVELVLDTQDAKKIFVMGKDSRTGDPTREVGVFNLLESLVHTEATPDRVRNTWEFFLLEDFEGYHNARQGGYTGQMSEWVLSKYSPEDGRIVQNEGVTNLYRKSDGVKIGTLSKKVVEEGKSVAYHPEFLLVPAKSSTSVNPLYCKLKKDIYIAHDGSFVRRLVVGMESRSEPNQEIPRIPFTVDARLTESEYRNLLFRIGSPLLHSTGEDFPHETRRPSGRFRKAMQSYNL
jgi:hypothetical protein